MLQLPAWCIVLSSKATTATAKDDDQYSPREHTTIVSDMLSCTFYKLDVFDVMSGVRTTAIPDKLTAE